MTDALTLARRVAHLDPNVAITAVENPIRMIHELMQQRSVLAKAIIARYEEDLERLAHLNEQIDTEIKRRTP